MKRMIAAAAALGLTFGLAACVPHQLDAAERQTAELGARDHADRSQSDYVGCSGQDSDNDGYVTCTVKNRQPPNAEVEILCSYKTGSRGCKRKS